MTLPELCIKRPVFATVLSLGVLLLGVISYSRLSVREYPKIDEPVVSVETVYKGASAAVVESTITKVLEDSLSGIEPRPLMLPATTMSLNPSPLKSATADEVIASPAAMSTGAMKAGTTRVSRFSSPSMNRAT